MGPGSATMSHSADFSYATSTNNITLSQIAT